MHVGVHRLNAILVVGVLGSSALLLLRRLIYLTNAGGGEYQHADWLINYSSGIVRRGISGELFLTLGQVTTISPLVLVSFFQALLTLALILGLLAKALQLRMPDMAVLLLLSPALVLFWVNDTTGAYRKELLGLAAFLPLLFVHAPARLSTVAVLTIFTAAVFFHEANLFLAPALTFALFIRLGPQGARTPSAILWVIAAVALVFTVSFMTVSDVGAMCQRLLDAGLSDQLCGGIFPWLEEGHDVRTFTAVELIVLENESISLPVVALMTVLLCLPCLWIARQVLVTRGEWLAFLVAAGSLFLLYPIASDWSRWLSMQVFVMTFLILMLAEDRQAFEQPISKPVFGLVIVLSLLVGIDQIAPMPLQGFIFNFLHAATAVLG